MERIVCICQSGTIFKGTSFKDDFDITYIYRLFFQDTIKNVKYSEENIMAKELILFPDFYIDDGKSTLSVDDKEKLRKILMLSDCNIVVHDTPKKHQKEIIKELLGNKFNEKRITQSRHNGGIYGDNFLKRIPKITNQKDWDRLFQDILNQFYDEVLEELIKNTIIGTDSESAVLYNYISEIQNKL